MITLKSVFSTYTVKTKEQVAQAYKIWAAGVLNISSKDRPKFFFEHNVLNGLTYEEFLKAIKEA